MKLILLIMLLPMSVLAQPAPVINTFPSLTIGTHARGWGMGNSGIAAATENQQLGYNIAKTAFALNFHQASVTYMPWMRSISNDSRLLHADYLSSIGNTSALGFAISYLDLGNVTIRDDNGATLGLYKSNDFNIGTSYALQLGTNASLGVTMKFLGSRYYSTTVQNQFSFCGDVSYYQFMNVGDGAKIEWGAVVSNLGPSINLPSSGAIGIAYTSHSQDGNQFSFSLDATRLLKDEWKGLRINAGAEYGFDETFFLRGGIALENKLKGNRKYFSIGAGYKGFISDQSWGLDIHYLVPFGVVAAVSPFQNAFGLTLNLNVGSFQ